VRIDSGDLLELARRARAILDASARADTRIFGSGDLDEWSIHRLVEAGAPYDAFGVGTELITSRDAPALSLVYKLVALNGQGKIKLSPGKKTYPLGKQVHRQRDDSGRFTCDVVTGADESWDGESLLVPVIRGGRLAAPLPTLEELRHRCAAQLAALPDVLRGVDAQPLYPMAYSRTLEAEAERLGVK
jgi:nicotinate phosphoribosyltransferase